MGYTHRVRDNLRSLVESVGRTWEDSPKINATVRNPAEEVGA
jgi:hypothetical protein